MKEVTDPKILAEFGIYPKEVTDPEILKQFGITNQENLPFKDPSFINKLAGYAEKFNNTIESSRLPSLAGGFLQGAGDAAASIANLPLGLIGAPKIPHPELQKHLPQDLLSKGAFLGGELASQIPAWFGIQNKISKMLPEATGWKRLGKEAIAGATTGALLGEEGPGGRLASAALGSIAVPSLGARSSKIGENISEHTNNITREYRKKYNDIFSTASQEGINRIKLPSLNYDLLKKNMKSKEFESINKLVKNPTLENAHWAQSDLNKFIRRNEGKNNPSVTNEAIEEAIKAQKKLKGKIWTEFNKKPDSGLSSKYAEVTKGYGEEVVPFKYNKNISKYMSGNMKASSLVNNLTKDDSFMLKQGEKFPELKLQELLRSPLGKIALGGTAVGLGFPPIYHNLSSNY